MTICSRHLGLIRDFTDGAARGFEPRDGGEDPLFVVRRGHEFYAYLDRCPHEGTRLPWRRDRYLNRDASRIVCYAHGAEFDVASGRCLLGPCLGQSLVAVDLAITERGEICVNHNSGNGSRT